MLTPFTGQDREVPELSDLPRQAVGGAPSGSLPLARTLLTTQLAKRIKKLNFLGLFNSGVLTMGSFFFLPHFFCCCCFTFYNRSSDIC